MFQQPLRGVSVDAGAHASPRGGLAACRDWRIGGNLYRFPVASRSNSGEASVAEKPVIAG